ncbi:MAG: UDP-N-acetylglucosamine diphosphorylase/glucosamine-1-phosphate N-acetyltransferase [Methylococcaceae bacterium]|nr:UDP-N-acetylglucosamine diphosphorylase/glucosamine-1-phosphate N-acetyltransferase [Methylococcaceae bacterium]
MTLQTIILAAGQGTRMRSALPKVLHRVGSLSLLEHVYRLADGFAGNDINIVYGHGGPRLRNELAQLRTSWTEQAEQLGTGHAVMQVADWIGDDATVLILYGDVPLLTSTTVQQLLALVGDHSMGLLTVELANPTGYGRILRDGEGRAVAIVEEKDADAGQRAIREVNTGIMALKGGRLKGWLGRLHNRNAQREYYLTDVIAMAVADGVRVETCRPAEIAEVLGVNTRAQLAELERVYQLRLAHSLMEQGVTLKDPARFDLRGQVIDCGHDVEIDVNVVMEGTIRLGNDIRIGPNVYLKDCEIGDGTEILANSHIEESIIGADARVGPYARIRPQTKLADQVHIGNFVELKKTTVGKGSKINHLTYVGDAQVGSGVNVGAGTITCNYDGVYKHPTEIGDGAFIGSNTQLVAPVKVGKNATIGAGSVITKDAPDDALTLSRPQQVTVAGWQRPTKKPR